MKIKELILQAAIGLILGLSLVKQEEYNRKLIQDRNAVMMKRYCNAIHVSYEEKDTFTKLKSQKCDRNTITDELLTKSKREKIFVTEDE